MTRLSIVFLTILGASSIGLVNHAHAQVESEPEPAGTDDEMVDDQGDGMRDPDTGALPTAESDDDQAPPVASPTMSSSGLVEQAGIGGQTAYGRIGVLELGGSAGFAMSSGFTQIDIAPTIGYFIADNLEVSAMLGLSYVEAGDQDATLLRLIAEPSYHLPFNNRTFGFFGLGAGVAHVENLGFGFAVAPRIGANFLVGRSGILTPALSYQYTTHSADAMAEGTTLLQVSSQVVANVGYTVMW